MSPRISQGAALVLLLAMMLAMAVGMMAWGPIQLPTPSHGWAHPRPWFGEPGAVDALACLPLLASSVWGMASLQRSRWPASLRLPCTAFFALASLLALSSAAYQLDPSGDGDAVNRAFAAGTVTMLVLAFLAERVDALFGSGPAVLGGAALVACATLWWFTGEYARGRGDLRPLLFIEYLPLLLVPAGALRLPGRFTRSVDWLAVLGLYLAALVARWVDQAAGAPARYVDGTALMHLLLAGLAAAVAYRAGVAPGDKRAATPSPSEPTQRRTSLNTSS